MEIIDEFFPDAVQAYIDGNWKKANNCAELAKAQDSTLSMTEYKRRARVEAQRIAGPIRGPQGEERWTETETRPLHQR